TFQDLSDDDLPGATADGDMEDFPQPEETAFLGSASSPDAVAAPPEETGEYAPDEPVMAGPVFLVEGRNRGKSHRLAWVALLLLFGAGLFWAMRAARFQDSAPIPVSEAVAAARSDSEPVALKPDEVSPPSDSATPAAAEAIPSQPEPTPTLAGDKSANEAKDRVAPSQGGQSEALAALEPPAPKRSAITPPSLSTIEPILAAQNNLPADDDGSALENGRPAEPPPAPEQPVKHEPPAPKVIRRSGDVLQNTAIIRARPVYPQAAREAGVKGAVTVEVTIDEGGNVIAARPISGPEPLRGAAVAAARRWKWIPARVDRNRAQVVGTITLNFRD
ncbi:MAG TPA: TonB family protein, partial [Blastocatellia bacterium]|nr:TonB family protein [Blastocatellia bacterium]